MKIVILGAGHTGASVASNLAKEGHDVVVVDINLSRLRELQDSADIATVSGVATHPDSLSRANIEEAELLISVLPRDEDNIVACQIAWSLYHPPFIVARIRNIHYLEHPELFSKDNIPIDELISPESLVTRYVQYLIEYPGVHQLHDFNQRLLKLVAVDVQHSDLSIDLLSEEFPYIKWLGLVNTGEIEAIPKHHFFQQGERIVFIVPTEKIADALAIFQIEIKPYKRIIIAGGGHVGKRLAVTLQDNLKVKIIEKEAQRARRIAEDLEKTMVLQGDATDPDLLVNEGISESDIFCALTSSDEANILSSMMAKKLGVKETVCLINRSAYVDMIMSSVIDIVFSPEKITSAKILRYVRAGGVINICPLHGTSFEVLEIVAEGKEETSHVVGHFISELNFPETVKLIMVIRGDMILNLEEKIVVETRDHFVLLVPTKEIITIEKYFQASL